MFQKHSMMSLKKKSKSLGHLTALGSYPCSPDVEPKMKKNLGESSQPSATKYMKRFLSPTSHDREPLAGKEQPLISSPMNLARTDKIDKQLQTRNKTTPKKLKGVIKGKTGNGGPIINGIGKVLMANFTPGKNGGRSGDSLADIFSSKDGALIPNKHRAFLMDTQVKYTIGLQSQERNLFLFNDLLLIAKERSTAHYKLKDQVPLSDVWLSNCISDVSEVTLDPTTSFVIGWPISNAVITFSSPAQRELWWVKLSELISVERSHSPAGASINITYFDNATNFEHLKSIYVSIGDSSRDCIQKALDILEISDSPNPNPAEFQLWVKTKLEESPYPLIGHEVPLVIKLHWMRQTFNNKNQKTYDEYRQGCRCSFILRKVGQVSTFNEVGSQKKKLKKVKSSIKLQNVFRRVSQGSRATEAGEAGLETDKKVGLMFGRCLGELCGGLSQTNLPSQLVSMMLQLEEKGPVTVGIFRRGPNVRAMRDLRDKLDEGEEVDWSEISVFVTAALVKDFLRSLPDCLLQCDNYSAWTEAALNFSSDRKIDTLRSHVERLPPSNNYLLKHLLFILNKVSENHEENMMTASNLSICVGPSLIWTQDQSYMMEQNYSKEVSSLVQILIEQYRELYDTNTPDLFCQSQPVRAGAGALESVGAPAERTSSLTSNKSEKSQSKQSKGTFDHSSLDSLLDPAYPEDDLARQSGTEGGVSLTNLSHDSGLTTSDSQLYAFEEPENSFSSDDFCIETITSNDNTVHAIVNKKFLSRYGNSYLLQNGEEFPLPGQVPDHHHHHHHGQQSSSPSRRKLQQRNAKNRDRMHRRIHRNSDYGGYGSSNDRETPERKAVAYNYEVRPVNKMNYPLRRTASEESVTVQRSASQFEMVSVNNNNRRKRHPGHRKGKAPNPPRGSKAESNIVRSNSVNQVRHWEKSGDWYRSKSTTRLHSEDSEDSCSTLSDEDSTPHVSRSNSYGRSETETGAGQQYSAQQDDTTYDIYLHDERTLDMGTNLENAFVNNARRRQNDRRDFDSFSCETPPGYEESLSSSYISPSPVRESSTHLSDKAIEKQSELSAKAKAVFEESLRQYENTGSPVKSGTPASPPPLPPKTDRPPLPPKQRSSRRSTEQESGEEQHEQTYVNSAELARQGNRARGRVSVTTQRQAGEEKEEFVYGNYYSGSAAVSSVTVPDSKVNPPSLPPKEREENKVKRKGVSTTRIVGTNSKPSTKSVETQTDENEFYFMYDSEGYKLEDDGYNNTDSEYSPESNRSISPDYSHSGTTGVQSYYRTSDSQSKTPEQSYYLGAGVNTLFERPVSAQSAALARQAGRRKLEPVTSVPARNPQDPVISGEINWSVSQLRSLFNQGLQSEGQNYVHTDNLAGFRSPARKQFLERRINFHGDMSGLATNYVNMYSPDSQHTDSDQESYV